MSHRFEFSPDGSDAQKDLWRLLLTVAEEPGRLAAMRLLFSASPLLRERGEAVLGPSGIWLGFSEGAFLVIAPAGTSPLPADAAASLRSEFGDLEIWRPVAIEETGFLCEPEAESTPEKPTTPSRLILTDTRFRYYPLWDARVNHALCYLCEPMWDIGDGQLRSEPGLGRPLEDSRQLLAIDLEVFAEVVRRIEAAVSAYGILTVLVPVHWHTLTGTETAKRFTAFCGERAWSVVDNLYFELVGVPDGARREDFLGAAERIDPFCRAQFLRTGLDFRNFDSVPSERFLSLGVDLRGDDRPVKELDRALARFVSATRKLGLRCHVHGLEDASLTAAAARAGFDYLGSDVIAPPMEADAPETKQPDATELLRQILRNAR